MTAEEKKANGLERTNQLLHNESAFVRRNVASECARWYRTAFTFKKIFVC
jgi:hypothetical protein